MQFQRDDLLVMVLQHLEVGQLLAARRVCRRWADLALRPEVWIHRHIRSCVTWHTVQPVKRGEVDEVVAALTLAPCIDSLDLSSAGLQRWVMTEQRVQ